MEKNSRRTYLKAVTAALASGTAGCAQSTPRPAASSASVAPSTVTPFRVNLICSGMLVFYWDLDKNSLRILIPQPKDGSQLVHLVRFGGIGGESLTAGNYILQLPGVSEPAGSAYGLSPNSNVLFGVDDPTKSLTVNSKGVFAQISIPRPNQVRLVRTIDKMNGSTDPFFGGDAVDFKINPQSIPGIYVLTYHGITGPPRLASALANAVPPPNVAPAPFVTNLHLYSQRPCDSTAEDHIGLFNGMFVRADNGKALAMTHSDFANAMGKLSLASSQDLGTDLAQLDLQTLAELNVTSSGSVAPPTAQPHLVVADPAGCSNGWVFYRRA